jgi:hypothetical protein
MTASFRAIRRLAKYANIADSRTPSGNLERRISLSIHRLPEVLIISSGLNIAPSFLCFSGGLVKRMIPRQSGLKAL